MSNVYENIHLLPGRGEARRSQRGWATFQKLWPMTSEGPAQARGTRGQTIGSVRFDVSDVDMTNFPELDCFTEVSRPTFGSCQRCRRHPGLGIAGWCSAWGKLYVKVKASPGDETKLLAAKTALFRWNPKGLNEDNLVIIPVMDDCQDLWRFSTVIDRFAYSSRNTLGITWSGLGVNQYARLGHAVYPLASMSEAKPDAKWDYRETVLVVTTDLQETLNALRNLLRDLDVPVDVVGVVAQDDATPRGRTIRAGAGSIPSPNPVYAEKTGNRDFNGKLMGNWLFGSAVGMLASIVFASTIFLAIRRAKLRSKAATTGPMGQHKDRTVDGSLQAVTSGMAPLSTTFVNFPRSRQGLT